MWPTSVPILVFLGLSVLDLGPSPPDVRDRETDVRDAHHRLMHLWGRGIIKIKRKSEIFQ